MGRKATQTAADILEIRRRTLENAKAKEEAQRAQIEIYEKANARTRAEIAELEEFINRVEAKQNEISAAFSEVQALAEGHNEYLEWFRNNGAEKSMYEIGAGPKPENYEEYMAKGKAYNAAYDRYLKIKGNFNAEVRAEFYAKKRKL